MKRFSKQANIIVDEAKREVEDFSKILSDKYGQFFPTSELLVFKPQDNSLVVNNIMAM